MKAPFIKCASSLLSVLLFCVPSLCVQESNSAPRGQEAGRSPAQGLDAVAESPESMSKGSELFAKLVEHNEQRTRELREYSGTRVYELRNAKDEISAREVVRMEFRAPGTKTFQTVSAKGSLWIRKFVFKDLMKREAEAAAGRDQRDSAITPHNYTFRYLDEQPIGGRLCDVVDAIPRRVDKYLFKGRVWIDARDFAVAKITGHPAKNPSFWIKHVDWTRSYGKFGEFWLPVKDVTLVDVRFFGKKKLIIEYRDYRINQPAATAGARSGAGTNSGRR